MSVIKPKVIDGFEYRSSSVRAKRSGTPASKVQQLIDLYAQHPGDAEVPVAELIENLEVLKRSMLR